MEFGIDTLLGGDDCPLEGRRVALVSHSAARTRSGETSAERLYRSPQLELACLLGPEHGFFGMAEPGEQCAGGVHPEWGVAIHSLYGETRKPTAAMLCDADLLVFDLQDLGARAYTYVSTLRNVLESAAELGLPVIVADRPVPLPTVVDGPVTSEGFESFVSAVETPLAYGMTPGETAIWLRSSLELDIELNVARMQGYAREPGWGKTWPAFVPPSPAIRSWDCARGFPALVALEALPALDHGRATGMAFQVFGANWLDARRVSACLREQGLPGVSFAPCVYESRPGEDDGAPLDGVRMRVDDPGAFLPALTTTAILYCVQDVHGREQLWSGTSRSEFFDLLMGTDTLRLGLAAGLDPWEIACGWTKELAGFKEQRAECLLYEEA